jgi:23S rRNA (adenine1618-N6)-methyltransferase
MNKEPRKPLAGSRATALPTRAAGLHPRNRHQGRYDIDALLALSPALARHIVRTPLGERSIDFAQPEAVRTLNAALLQLHYGVRDWQLPAGYLCPPVPGRADYLHGLADLLASDRGGAIPRGAGLRVLDVGTGANLVYPLIGHAEYGWTFVGSDIDAAALAIAARTLAHNPRFAEAISLRLQPQRNDLFKGAIAAGERFAASLCNPPFHASAAEAALGSARKWRNLGKAGGPRSAPRLNFGGQSNELWCSGGEAGFLRRMVAESATLPEAVGWYTSLVAKAEHLSALRQQLDRLGARAVREQRMSQGNKQSRFLAWSFLDAAQRVALSAGA